MGSRKKIVRGGKTKNIPKTYGNRDPPHGENGLYVERNDSAHIEKNTLIGETVSPHMKFFYSCSPPPPPPPRASANHDLHSLCSICLR